MLTKTKLDEIHDFLGDASYLTGGFTSEVVFPESAEEVAQFLAKATRDKTPVTISGAGTGTVARSSSLRRNRHRHRQTESASRVSSRRDGGHAVAEAGVRSDRSPTRG